MEHRLDLRVAELVVDDQKQVLTFEPDLLVLMLKTVPKHFVYLMERISIRLRVFCRLVVVITELFEIDGELSQQLNPEQDLFLRVQSSFVVERLTGGHESHHFAKIEVPVLANLHVGFFAETLLEP